MGIKLRLNSVEDVKEFVSIVSRFESDMDLSTHDRRGTVDARSIMGIFSLDLSKDLILFIYNNTERQDIEAALVKFTERAVA